MSSIFAGFCCYLTLFTVSINIIEITLNAQTRVMMQLSLSQCFSLFFVGVNVEESDVTLCGMNACSCSSVVQLDWQAATGFLRELHFTDMSFLREHCV